MTLENEMTPAHVEIPGTGASFAVPADFSLSDRFDGFVARDRTIEVIVSVIKSPFQGIADGFTDSVLKSRGIDVLSRSEAVINGSRALLLKALHPDGGKKWGKWIMLLESGGDTLVVNGVFVSGDVDSATDVLAMLKSVVLKAPARADAPDGEDDAVSVDLPIILEGSPDVRIPEAASGDRGDDRDDDLSADLTVRSADAVSWDLLVLESDGAASGDASDAGVPDVSPDLPAGPELEDGPAASGDAAPVTSQDLRQLIYPDTEETVN
ncbi:MAG: hypothetical protein LBQ56_00370 [Synergistaceae bacterium]|nr:hypothetical protein [Synergistaceae bacterium]